MSATTTGSLHAILEWTKAEGEVKALDRMRMFCLGALLADNILGLTAIDAQTSCSDETLAAVRSAAEKVVGRPCPK